MSVKLLTEHHLEFLSLKEGCTGSSESTHVKIPHCWKSHVKAQMHFAFQLEQTDIRRRWGTLQFEEESSKRHSE